MGLGYAELVAFRVCAHGPMESRDLMILEAQPTEFLDVSDKRFGIVGAEVEMEAVLAGLLFGHLLEGEGGA